MAHRRKYSILSQAITDSVHVANLPRTSIHDGYALKFSMRLTNTSGSSATPLITDILNAITEISLVSDSVRNHYSLNGLDLARLNYRIDKVNKVLDMTYSALADDAYVDTSFVLYLDEGEILAVAYTNLELKVLFGSTAGTGIDISNAKCEIGLIEEIYSEAELKARYGERYEKLAEPKVYALSATCDANTEFSGFLDIPTGTLLKGAMLTFTTDPSLFGILRTVPDRVELMKQDWTVARAIDELIYGTSIPTHIVTMDFGVQWQANGIGKDGWSYSKGDIQLAAKTSSSTTVRYVSIEQIVDIDLYKKTYAFTTY
ncbi:hypothetical protein [uncultured Methanocorpusculum sp.]|nr:hypothetical protein [uncultured Methanocorpusculum sp.]